MPSASLNGKHPSNFLVSEISNSLCASRLPCSPALTVEELGGHFLYWKMSDDYRACRRILRKVKGRSDQHNLTNHREQNTSRQWNKINSGKYSPLHHSKPNPINDTVVISKIYAETEKEAIIRDIRLHEGNMHCLGTNDDCKEIQYLWGRRLSAIKIPGSVKHYTIDACRGLYWQTLFFKHLT